MPRQQDKKAPADATDGGFFEEIEHTADVALRCGGPDRASLFRGAARGMYHLMGIGEVALSPAVEQTVSLAAMDIEGLLVDWLGELAYLAETRGLVFTGMTFRTLTATRLEAVLAGGQVDGFDLAIKAVTYHRLKVEQTRQGYTATVVFDV